MWKEVKFSFNDFSAKHTPSTTSNDYLQFSDELLMFMYKHRFTYVKGIYTML